MKLINYFNIKEFLVDPAMRDDDAVIPVHVVDKIIEHHLPELNDMRYRLNAPLYISKHSGYRSVEWEVEHGRSGNSQHTFKGLGAVDITAEDMDKLLSLAQKSSYKRVCYYPKQKFLHCDFHGDHYHYFIDNGDGWEYNGIRRDVK